MARRLVLRVEAERDLNEAFDWYEQQVAGLGSAFLLATDAIFHSVVRQPMRYPIVYKGVRQALMRRFPYKVLFLAEAEQVTVLGVFHAKRNPQCWQERC
jgi:plasmid stabilization system protein ParE